VGSHSHLSPKDNQDQIMSQLSASTTSMVIWGHDGDGQQANEESLSTKMIDDPVSEILCDTNVSDKSLTLSDKSLTLM